MPLLCFWSSNNFGTLSYNAEERGGSSVVAIGLHLTSHYCFYHVRFGSTTTLVDASVVWKYTGGKRSKSLIYTKGDYQSQFR